MNSAPATLTSSPTTETTSGSTPPAEEESESSHSVERDSVRQCMVSDGTLPCGDNTDVTNEQAYIYDYNGPFPSWCYFKNGGQSVHYLEFLLCFYYENSHMYD